MAKLCDTAYRGRHGNKRVQRCTQPAVEGSLYCAECRAAALARIKNSALKVGSGVASQVMHDIPVISDANAQNRLYER